jgi:hypothetical protein
MQAGEDGALNTGTCRQRASCLTSQASTPC